MLKNTLANFFLSIIFLSSLSFLLAIVQAIIAYISINFFQIESEQLHFYELIASLITTASSIYAAILFLAKRSAEERYSKRFPNAPSNPQFNELRKHFIIRQSQAQWSFRFAIIFTFFGLSIVGYITFIPHEHIDNIVVITGAISTFIGGTIFILHRRMLKATQSDIEKITEFEKAIFALKELEKIEDKKIKDKQRSSIISEFLNKDTRPTTNDELVASNLNS